MSSATDKPQRHMLVWLHDEGWRAAIAGANAEHRDHLARWHHEGWPVVVRRPDPEAAPDEICLGLPLPPQGGTGKKIRIALRARDRHVRRIAPALELTGALHAAGPWRDRLDALCEERLPLRVYGSLAMQSLTGLPYLTPASDIDILFHPCSRQQLDDGVALLAHHGVDLPLDGEIVFPLGQAVAWKEWLMAQAHPARVLVKDFNPVRLADPASLLATLEAP
jgi:phosphoribosyl-dephospho-CoA transferase